MSAASISFSAAPSLSFLISSTSFLSSPWLFSSSIIFSSSSCFSFSSSSLCILSQTSRSSLVRLLSCLARSTFICSIASLVLRSSSCFAHSSFKRRSCSFFDTESARSEADQPLSSQGRGSESVFLRRKASALAASASSRTYGVINTSSSERCSSSSTLENSHLPIQGISFKIGIPDELSETVRVVKPPKMTDCPFSRLISADIIRVTATSICCSS